MCSLTAYDLVVQVFSDYQMEIMSKHVVTQFGFADTQFNDNDDQLRYSIHFNKKVLEYLKKKKF